MLPYPWRRSISLARTGLGIACLAMQVVWGRYPFWFALPLLAFVGYSLFALRRSLKTDGSPLATLLIDTAAFLLWLPLSGRAGYPDAIWAVLAMAIYVFLLATAIMNQTWRIVSPVALVSLAALSVVPVPGRLLLLTPMVGCTVVGAVWVLNHAHLEARLSRASRHSVRYRFEAQQAREDERRRMAADFHDGPLQSFIGLQMRLEIVKRLIARDLKKASDELTQLQELCRAQVGELRAFVRGMRAADEVGSSLGASISRMVEQFQKDTGISTSFMSGDYVDTAETGLSIELLQVVREALNNVQKHAKANRVDVVLNKNGTALEISIDDNGSGFPFGGTYSLEELDLLHLGPVSIRRRVRALRGDLTVESRPGKGSGVKVRVNMA